MQFTPIEKLQQMDEKDCIWMHGYTFCLPCGSEVNKEQNFCPVCTLVWNMDTNKNETMLCNGCNRWLHFGCSNLSQKELKAQMENEHQEYFCTECKQKQMSLEMMKLVDRLIKEDRNH